MTRTRTTGRWLLPAVAVLALLVALGCRTYAAIEAAPEGAWVWVWQMVEAVVLDIVDIFAFFL